MNTLILALAITAAQIILGLAMGCAAFRVMRGPRAQDRVLGLDALYLAGMLLLLTYGIQTGRTLFFEGALVIALLGFAGTVAFAKFLMRGEVIE
ncbi:K+/H+ antiporter subunit F [Sphingomonas koreensis]|uniref:Multisubunit potassium/proton antiporter, PhaF subunit n=1 Tax=Novosphingobium pentaromativorans US6-1 TaxID=1088721 RepID=G6EK08_9SPHN|nr:MULTISPECIES: K+/H+ antiporter subunit F [Sphingomonadaceae]AIT82512.1 monovalent cation/H+ antiporter subunit F [Novosphingobium pentaromativorans US6-1]EHJ58347.1 multisubunit potassium/proton antiporter, PhaF subunit [Novosphingobium pentaromativorans US6-1]RSU74506.1 K+/H+ antiporter subunit F [Sphingomonas koreensis]RSV52740.1 K+/H+ antiporter subunit F [Sphingomonas koreensis]RSX22352.1 K+/H+ antiporter subunit F [Sphingomonas koreensis]